jgi:phage host-nuclease inhibitor protein Gam
MSPDSVESRIARLDQRVEDLSIMVQVVGSLPTQVGTLDYKADELARNLERMRQHFDTELRRLRDEIEALEKDVVQRDEAAKKRQVDREETARVERKSDMRWRITQTSAMVLGIIGIILTILATYG